MKNEWIHLHDISCKSLIVRAGIVESDSFQIHWPAFVHSRYLKRHRAECRGVQR